MRRSVVLCVLGSLVALLATGAPARAQFAPIPIEVFEALPDDPRADGLPLPGLARTNEPVSLGLPLADAAGIANENELGLNGASVGQFRVLSRWPSGNLQWVLVDTLASLPAHGVAQGLALTRGSGDFGGAALATQTASAVQIDTGVAQFSVSRTRFNLLDRVVVGGVELVAAGASSGAVLTGVDVPATTFLGANDAAVSVEIEENGPVRAVVVARGTHRSANGARGLDFTARLHFVRGKSRVRLYYTLRNARRVTPMQPLAAENPEFASLELVLHTSLTTPGFELPTHQAPLTGVLAPAETAALFVGENAYPNLRDYDFDDGTTAKWPTTIAGYTVRRDATLLASGTREDVIDLLYARAASASGALTVGTRYGSGWWPQGLAVEASGAVRIGLFPRGNDRSYVSRFAGHVTREVLLDFEAGTPSATARDAMFRFEYPLAGRAAAVSAYNDSGALWEPLLAIDDEAARYIARGWPILELLARRPEFLIYRHYYWGTGGGNNQYDFTKIDLHNFLRRDADYAGGYWVNAEQRIAYNADLAIYHSDDFDAADDNLAARFEDLPNANRIPSAKVIFEGEHRHAYGIPLLYYLSGDERLREAYLDWGDWMRGGNTPGFNSYERGFAWNVYNLIDLYRFSADVRYRDLAWQIVEQRAFPAATDPVPQPDGSFVSGLPGTDYLRGAFVSTVTARDLFTNPLPGPGRVLTSFVYGAMIPRTYAYLHDYGDLAPLQRDRVRDLLEGASRFVVDEHWYEYPQPDGSLRDGDFGFVYAQSLDSTRQPVDARQENNWFEGQKEAWNAFYFGYLTTGEGEFLRRGELQQRAAAVNRVGFNYHHDWPDRQRLQVLLDAPNVAPVWRSLPLTASEAGGACRLSWMVPASARAYWIKTADRPIVPTLGFDRVARTYAFAPATFVPFFAATNLDGEPAPTSPGALQDWTLPGVCAGRSFAARALIAPMSAADRVFASGFE